MRSLACAALAAVLALASTSPAFAQIECLFGLCGDFNDDIDVSDGCPSGISNRQEARTGQDLYYAKRYELTAGGSLNLSECLTAPGSGYLAETPDLSLSYQRDDPRDLRIRASGGCDLTLLVNDPGAGWTFSDDANGRDPEVRFSDPVSGRYDIWVGTVGADNCSAELEVESFVLDGGSDSNTVTTSDNASAGACPSAATSGRTLDLSAATLRDGRTMSVSAGGVIPLSQCDQIDGLGYAHATPDYSLSYDRATMGDLKVSATSSCDTFLLANDPSERWWYNDDVRGHDPELVLRDLPDGRLDFWIGTLGNDDCPTELTFTSLSGGGLSSKNAANDPPACPSATVSGAALDLSASALRAGRTMNVTAGGVIPLSQCDQIDGLGYAHPTPDYSLSYDRATMGDLKVSATSTCDTFLLANDPSQRWWYNDDVRGHDPELVMRDLPDGRLDFWIGTLGNDDCSADLTFTSLSQGRVASGGATSKAPRAPAQACPSDSLTGESLDFSTADLYSPRIVPASAGGANDLSTCESVSGSGFLTSQPTYSLNLVQAGGHDLKLRVRGSCDTVMLVNDFHRTWHFSDDAVDRDPEILLKAPETGRIDIWIGTIGSESCKAKLELETF